MHAERHASAPEGEIGVALLIRGGRVASCRITSTRPDVAQALLRGRSRSEIAAVVPRIYAVCGASQALASALACAAAAGTLPDADALARSQAVLEAETLRETALRMLLDWPRAIGEVPDAAAVAAAKSVREMQSPDAREHVAQAVFGAPAAVWLGIESASDYAAWAEAGATAAARYVRVACEAPAAPGTLLAGARAVEPDFMDERPGAWRAADTGPLARHHDDALLAALRRAGTAASALRFAARLRELALLLTQRSALAAGAAVEPDGAGVAWVENARGVLVHGVRLREGRAVAYRIVAPTDRHFHPAGPLHQALAGSAADDAGELRRRAQRLVDSLDPCVGCRVEVEHA